MLSKAFNSDGRKVDFKNYNLAITGDVYQYLVENVSTELFKRVLLKTRVYARMSPDQKNCLVSSLQNLGYVVLFVGDGANDCSALTEADVGLSLSADGEASLSSPFTSSSQSLLHVPLLIREGRAALVISFSCFKYMALYSFIQFSSVTMLYSFGTTLSDHQFLFIDLFLIIPVAMAMARSKAYKILTKKKPTSSLVSSKVLISLMGQAVINFFVQLYIFIWVRNQSWYIPPQSKSNAAFVSCWENSALFLVSSYQYIFGAIVFSNGKPWSEPIYKNGINSN